MNVITDLISGAGNTFQITFGPKGTFNNSYWTTQKKKSFSNSACEKNKSDGFIFLEKSAEDNSFDWFFYNNDGSVAEMCGNATRCVGFYIKNIIKDTGTHWNLNTIAGKIEISFIASEKFKILMTEIMPMKTSTEYFLCDTGVPHLILQVDEIKTDESTKQSSRKLRFDEAFQPRGTNVTQAVLTEHLNKVKAISYERGVEDFTQACGTGAMAAAYYNLAKRGIKHTEVEMPGGTLIMDLSNLQKPKMTGPAVWLGRFEYETN